MFYKLRKTFLGQSSLKKAAKNSLPKETLTANAIINNYQVSDDETDYTSRDEHSATLHVPDKTDDSSFSGLEESIKSLTLRPGHHLRSSKEVWLPTPETLQNEGIDAEKFVKAVSESLAPILSGGHKFVIMDNIDERVAHLGGGTVAWCDVCLRPICGTIQTRRCESCQLVCHQQCCEKIPISCKSVENTSISIQRHASMSQERPQLLEKKEVLPSLVEDGPDDTLRFDSSSYSSNTVIKKPLVSPTVKLSRSVSSPHSKQSAATPSFVNLLSQMSQVHSRLSTMEASASRDRTIVSTSGVAAQLREASHVAMMTPYDLNTADDVTLRKHGIRLRVVPSNENSCSSALSVYGIANQDEFAFSNDVICWRWEELNRRVNIFSGNNQGLNISLPPKYPSEPWSCTGNIRVFINFIRTVHLAPTGRPSSVFDFVANQSNIGVDTCNALQDVADTQGPVWLPRGVSKLLHIELTMTTKDVIMALLSKFKIKDNPRKFALYEHTIEGEKEVSVRKLGDNESPLVLLLTWANTDLEQFNATLLIKRLVLQENDTEDIEWTVFSVPELTSFLSILNKEENEYKERIVYKYELMRKEIQRLVDQKRRAS